MTQPTAIVTAYLGAVRVGNDAWFQESLWTELGVPMEETLWLNPVWGPYLAGDWHKLILAPV